MRPINLPFGRNGPEIDETAVRALRQHVGGGTAGWSPVIAGETDGERRVLKVVDWTGGAGEKPDAIGYIAPTGLSPDISAAIDVRGVSDVTEQAVLAALGFTPADAADLEAKADLVDGKVPAAQLPAPPTVPTFATVAEVRAGTADGKIISPKVMADALATVAVTPATAATGLDFSGFINAEVALTGNLTVGPPSGGFARKTGEIDFVQDATGGRTVAFHADYIVPANFSLQATANGRTSVPYRYQANGKVRLYNPSKWSA